MQPVIFLQPNKKTFDGGELWSNFVAKLKSTGKEFVEFAKKVGLA